MPARFLLLLALTLGLALGSGPIPAGCPAVVLCTCCPMPDATPCCSSDDSPAQESQPAAPTTSTVKQALSPVFTLVGVAPSLTVEMSAMRRQIAARTPAPSRLALLCTRLI